MVEYEEVLVGGAGLEEDVKEALDPSSGTMEGLLRRPHRATGGARDEDSDGLVPSSAVSC